MRPYTIIAAVDRSDSAPIVVEQAVDVAGRYPLAEIHVLGVIAPGPARKLVTSRLEPLLADLESELRALVEEKLADMTGPSATPRTWRIRVHARAGVPHEEILLLAEEARADLVILGRHGVRARRRFELGSVPTRLLRHARCAVLIAQPRDYEESAERGDLCPACVEVRRESDGEAWFCHEHSAHAAWRTSFLEFGPSSSLGGPGLWS